MFLQNGIDIHEEELMEIFNIVDQDGSGSLSLDEFFTFVIDKTAADDFRKVVKKVRQRIELDFVTKQIGERSCVPFSFDQMMSYLYNKSIH